MTFDEYLEEQLKDEKVKKEYEKLQMKEVKVICPKCKAPRRFDNYWHWVWKTPFHWLWWDKDSKRIRDYRLTYCHNCGSKSWTKRIK
jgi:hypothetical protein